MIPTKYQQSSCRHVWDQLEGGHIRLITTRDCEDGETLLVANAFGKCRNYICPIGFLLECLDEPRRENATAFFRKHNLLYYPGGVLPREAVKV